MSVFDGYPVVTTVDVPAGAYDEQGHLNNVAVLSLFEKLRRHYMLKTGRLRREMLPPGIVIGVREMVCSYVTEALPSEGLHGACRVLGRSRRSYLFDEVLTAGERVVARARVLECVIDREAGRAIEIPADFWAIFERMEGREMPPGPLPFPRTDW
ncbi:MAG: acyl-CoA thioesterase [Actinomycetes bacterium]